MISRRLTTLLAACAAVTLSAGCATTVAGTAQPDPAGIGTSISSPQTSATSGPATSDLPTTSRPGPPTSRSTTSTPPSSSTPPTSPGTSGTSTAGTGQTSYPSTPLQYNKTPSSAESANVLEAHRIAGYLVVPTLVDPSYTDSASISTLAYKGPSAMSTLFGSSAMPTVAKNAGMITGFSSARHDADNNGVVVAAFEFGSAAKATAAAPALTAAAADKEHDKGRAAVPGFAAATGWYGAFDPKTPYFHAFLAQGAMVLYVYISGPKLTATTQQAALAARMFAAETAGLSHFVPTAPDKLMQLPVDPQGMRARTLPHTGDNATVNDGLFSADGQLHFDTEPVKTKAIFESAGVDMVSDGRAAVYRARDENGATLVQADFIASTQNSDKAMQPYELTSGAKNTKCLQQALDSSYYCVGTVGRYAFELGADNEADLEAAVTAQAALLAGF